MSGSKKILIVDDSSTNVVLLDAVLNEKGYQIFAALSVKDAYVILEKDIPDLIILDLLMPKINGYDFLAKIRSDSRLDQIPVILVSAVTESEDVKKALSYGGIVDFIQKPVDIEQISELVDSVFIK